MGKLWWVRTVWRGGFGDVTIGGWEMIRSIRRGWVNRTWEGQGSLGLEWAGVNAMVGRRCAVQANRAACVLRNPW